MKCPRCGETTSVVETRSRDNFTVMRRRECECCGHRFTTHEMHSTPAHHNMLKVGQFTRASRRRIEIRKRDIYIADNLFKGWQPLADQFDLTESGVYYAAARGRRYKAQEKRQ